MNIKHKRNITSGVVPASGELVAGEIAINTADARIYAKKNDGTVVALNPVYAATSHQHEIADVTALVPAVRFAPLAATHRLYSASNGTALTAAAMTVNTIVLSPMVAPASFTAASIRLSITGAVAGSSVVLGIYAAGENGWPIGAPLANTGTLSGAAAIEVSGGISVNISRGTQYWLAAMTGSPAANVRRIPVGNAFSLGQTAAGTAHAVSIIRSITFGTWPNFTTNPVAIADLSTTVPTAVMITT